ncbi:MULTISPECIES: hypothetical protein [unclassified Rhodanobacter]|uniref:Uncharacterized protein n=1 Tax=Rhodanobacter humi TaxID=1888173 RepID=A0ABV4AV14_9GAMM
MPAQARRPRAQRPGSRPRREAVLLADLCAFTWRLQGNGLIRVESRDEVIKRIGRSPDYASAALLALIDTPKSGTLLGLGDKKRGGDYDPLEQMDREMGQGRL